MNDDLVKKLYEEIKKRKLDEQEDDMEMDDNDDDLDNDDLEDTDMNDEENSTNDEFCEMVSKLFHSQTQAHIYHLSVKGSGSYATHKALQDYYESIGGLVDGLTESYQGKYGLLTNYSTSDLKSYTSVSDVINYFEELNEMIEDSRSCCEDSFIQNQIDTVQELIFSTVYKLKFLK
jgi:DNA-binding ferritin-like protein